MEFNFDEIKKGIDLVWNTRYDEAIKLFSAKKDIYPRHALHMAEAVFIKSFITADSMDTNLAIEYTRHAKNLARQHQKMYEKGIIPPGVDYVPKKLSDGKENRKGIVNALLDARLIYGDSLYFSSVLKLIRGSKIKGVLGLRSSWKSFQHTTERFTQMEHYHPELIQSLHFGSGFFLFIMSIIPAKFLRLVELVGFKADRDLGLQYMRECVEEGGIRGPLATCLLLFNDILLPRGLADTTSYIHEAKLLLKNALASYPKGAIFQILASHCYRKDNQLEIGMEYIEKSIASCSHMKSKPLMFVYELCSCYIMQGRWKEAIEGFVEIMSNESFQIRALSSIQLAGAHMMLGNTEEARLLWKKTPEYIAKNNPIDNYCGVQANNYLKNGGIFSVYEILYLRRDLVKLSLDRTSQVLLELKKIARDSKYVYECQKKIILTKEIGLISQKNCSNNNNSDSTPKALLTKMSRLSLFASKEAKEKEIQLNNEKNNEKIQYSNVASYLLIKGCVFKCLEENEKAKLCFRKILQIREKLSEHSWFLPYAYFELAETYFYENNIEESILFVKQCNKFKDYIWEDPLKIRLRIVSDQLKKAQLDNNTNSNPKHNSNSCDASIDDFETPEKNRSLQSSPGNVSSDDSMNLDDINTRISPCPFEIKEEE